VEGGGRYIQLRSLGSLFQNREDFCQEPLQARGERPTIASERSIISRDVILRIRRPPSMSRWSRLTDDW
jgi:hypothetical protein